MRKQRIPGILACTSLLQLGLCLDAGALSEMPSEEPAFKQSVDKIPAIAIRMRSDRRIQSFYEKIKGKDAVHVYLVLSELSTPYAFSLGWFIPVNSASGELAEDELSQRIPVPGVDAKKTVAKSDLAAFDGFDLISEGKLKAAGDRFESAVKENPKSARMHNNLGVYYALTGKSAQAEEEFTTALNIKPDYTVANVNAAWFELEHKRPGDAFAIARQIEIPGFAVPRLAAARAALALASPQQARDIAATGEKDAVLGKQFMELEADADCALGHKDTAKPLYEECLQINPQDVTVLLKLSKIEQQTGNLDSAIVHARSATEVSPDDPRTHLYLGLYLEDNRDYRRAELQFERALDLRPADSIRQSIYGPMLRVLLAQARAEDADKYTRQWIKKFPNDSVCHYNRAWFAAALKTAEAKNEAIKEYDKALELDPKLSQARYNIALLYMDIGQSKPALLQLKAFLKQAPEDADAGKARELVNRLDH